MEAKPVEPWDSLGRNDTSARRRPLRALRDGTPQTASIPIRDQEAGGSNPLAPTIYPFPFQMYTADLRDSAEAIGIGTVPSFVPTLCHSCSLHRRQHGLLLRVNVLFGRRKVAVAGKISKGVRVHMRGPAREASLPERVKREACDVGDRISL